VGEGLEGRVTIPAGWSDASPLIATFTETQLILDLVDTGSLVVAYYVSEGRGTITWSAAVGAFPVGGQVPIDMIAGAPSASPAFARQLYQLIVSAYENVRLHNRFVLGKV
jgi:hypothetical protein